MPTWLTVIMLTPMALWVLVYGLLFFITDGEALMPGLGAGSTFTFAFPLFGLWMLLDGLIADATQQALSGLLVLVGMGVLSSAIYLFRWFADRNKDRR